MNYKILTKEAFPVIGKGARILARDKYTLLPKFWKDRHDDGTIERLHNIGGSRPILGIGSVCDSDGYFSYTIGVESDSSIEGFELLTVPASTWAVFEPVESKPKAVGMVWEYIFTEFLPKSIYKHAGSVDFEANYKRPDSLDYDCEIWIPLIEG